MKVAKRESSDVYLDKTVTVEMTVKELLLISAVAGSIGGHHPLRDAFFTLGVQAFTATGIGNPPHSHYPYSYYKPIWAQARKLLGIRTTFSVILSQDLGDDDE